MAIKGIYAASMSIFNEDLSLDIDSTIKHSERLIEEGCHGCVLLGSTGSPNFNFGNMSETILITFGSFE